jgi:hypothetical protein
VKRWRAQARRCLGPWGAGVVRAWAPQAEQGGIDGRARRRRSGNEAVIGQGGADGLATRCQMPVTPSFKAKTECIPLCVLGSSFTHKATDSEVNSIAIVYYIESHYKTYYKTKMPK